jgi:hypothetical protein
MAPAAKRSVSLLVGIVAFAAGALAYQWYFWWWRPPGNGPVAITVDKARFAKAWTGRPVMLVGIGDSVTAGFGASAGRSYFDRLVANPPDEFHDMAGLCLRAVIPNLTATNLAVSGSTSLQHVRQQVPKLKRQAADVLGLVVMTSGGNDLIHDYGRSEPKEGAMFGATYDQARPWIDAYSRRLGEMIGFITNSFPGGCHVFLADIYDPSDGVGDVQRAGPLPSWPDGLKIHAEYNRIVTAFCETHGNVHLVRKHRAFLGHGIHCRQFWRTHFDGADPHYWFHENLEDPNDRGYDALRRLFLNEIAGVMTPAGVAH